MQSSKHRIIILLSLLLLLGFLTTSLASYFVSRSSLLEEIDQNTLPLTSDNIYSEIQRDLLRPIFISSLMASDTFLRDWVLNGEQQPEQITRYLKEIQTKYNTVTSFFVSEKTRTYYHTNGILKKVDPDEPRDSWYFRVREMEPAHEINVDPDMANTDAMTIFINYKVFDYGGNYIGAAGVGLTVNAVKTLIETYQQRYNRDIFFADGKGNITLSSAGFSGRGSRLQEMPGLAELATAITTQDNLTLTYQRQGQTVHLNTRYIKEFGWHLLVEQTEDEAIEQIFDALLANLGICALITAIVLFITNRALSAYQNKLETLASTDKLTGAYNRNSFDALFAQASADCHRNQETLSMILFDLDHFKSVNDTFGHHAGDSVLTNVSERVQASVRESDLFFRWGGEEFLIVLKACDQKGAFRIAETVRTAIHDAPLYYEQAEILVTASFGVAQADPQEDANSLIKKVDQALYAAKANGRNRSDNRSQRRSCSAHHLRVRTTPPPQFKTMPPALPPSQDQPLHNVPCSDANRQKH